jgi:hypothetical protein
MAWRARHTMPEGNGRALCSAWLVNGFS